MASSNDLSKENEDLMQKAREERSILLKEAQEAKNKIINEAKELAKMEASKIIEDASAQIEMTKMQALQETEAVISNTLVRELDFPPDLVEAGLSLLNHFSGLINHKYAGLNIRVRIEQLQNKIKLSITSLSGDVLEMIEEDLINFSKVVQGKMPIESIVSDPVQVMKFNHKMELLALELQMTKRLMQLTERNIDLLEKDKQNLFTLINRSLSQLDYHQDIIWQLMQESGNDKQLHYALQIIREELGKAQLNTDIIINSLSTIQETSPKKASKIGEYIINFLSGTAGGVLVEIIKQRFLG